jgi:heterodisulfide reductase subunit A
VKAIKAKMDEHKANRVVLGTCAPFLSRRLATGIAVDPSLVQVVNLREEVAWPNRKTPAAATNKARALISMAVERLRLQEPAAMSHIVTRQSALVIGGGLAGMVAAKAIADLGYEVHIVQRGAELGGRVRNMHSTLERNDVQTLLRRFVQEVESHPHIHAYKGAEVVGVEGHAGNFDVKFTSKDGAKSSLEVGSIVITTGATSFKTTEYLYGQNENVITQDEFENKLVRGDLDGVKSVAMIQCVGSREEARPYCSRVCCSQALMNALSIKEKKPEADVVVFYRDLMSYGLIEKYYTQAREKGVLFVRYDLDSKPEVKAEGGKLKITAREPAIRGKITIEPDLLVLSTPLIPRDEHKLAKLLALDLSEDGFFQEAEVKFRPVDCQRDGMFICGLAHSPRSLGESIVQAQAAGQRASSILSKGKLRSGRMVSEVKERWCVGCGMCITVCPYSARVKDEKKGVAVVIEALCQGCGACVVTCPSGAASLRGLSDKQVLAMMDAAL